MDLGNKLKIDCSDCRWHSDPPWVRERGKEVAVKNWSFQDVQFHSTGSSMFPYSELTIWGCAHSISNWICKSFKVMDLLYDYVEIMKGCVWVCMCLEISHEISVLVAFIWSTWLPFWGLCRVSCMHSCLRYNQFCYSPTWFSMSLELMLSATVIQVHSNWNRYEAVKNFSRNSIIQGQRSVCWSTIVMDVRSLLLFDFMGEHMFTNRVFCRRA